MGISTEKKQEIIDKYKLHESDTGSPEVQIALISEQINDITEHLKKNPKDYSSRRGLKILSSKRKKLLNYLRRKDIERFNEIKEKLNIRA